MNNINNSEQHFKYLYDNYKNKKAVIALSGGMDSTTLLYYCKKTLNMDLMAISFFYGQNHSKELDLAKKVCEQLNVPHQLINIDFLGEITKGVSSLTSGGDKIPEGKYDDDNMASTVVSFRNGIILSVLSSYAEAHKCDVVVYGAHAGDHCFTRDTKILTPNGNKTIRSLKVGDDIYSFNLTSEMCEIDKVTDIIEKNIVSHVNRIITLDGYIDLTDEHKVYVFRPHEPNMPIEKVMVSKLNVGDCLINPEYELDLKLTNKISFTKIISIEKIEYHDNVFDISVEKNHNFFAGSRASILISNSQYPDTRVEFIDAMKEAIYQGTMNNVNLIAPFEFSTKSDIAKIGHELKVPYELTWSCYKGNERPCLKCMEENVDILMSNYTYKKIKDLVPGDEIFSWSEEKRTLLPSKVVEVHNNGIQLVKDYIMSNGDKLPCTPEHKVGKKGNSTRHIMYVPIEKVNDADKNKLYFIDWRKFFLNNYNKAYNRKYPEPKDFYLVNLLRWENEREAQTYDITTTMGNYIANNYIVHNCGTCTERTLSFMENGLTDPSLTGEEWEEAAKIAKELYFNDGENN